MKKIIVILFILTFILGCQPAEEEYNLPPTPPPPGGQAIYGAGLAIGQAIPPWAAPAKNMDLSSKEIFPDKVLTLQISNFAAIYEDAYFFNQKSQVWEKIPLFGADKTGDWIKGSAVASLTTEKDKLKYGNNHIIFYACNKIGSKWGCNNNKWLITSFVLKEKPAGAAPAEKKTSEMVIAANIEPFFLQKTKAEEDNFEEILNMRYDAEYLEPETSLKVVVRIFELDSTGDLTKSLNSMFKEIINQGWKEHKGQNLAVYLDVNDVRNAMWTSGNKLIFIETYSPSFANQDIIDAYLNKYPSDLKKI